MMDHAYPDAPARRDDSADAAALRDDLAAALTRFQEAAQAHPGAGPVQQLARDLADRCERGGVSLDALDALVGHLTVSAFAFRARRTHDYMGECAAPANLARFRELIAALARNRDGRLIAFDAFRARIEREAMGIVVTAHPTFAISAELTAILARLIAEREEDGTPLAPARRAALMDEARRLRHGSPAPVTLATEMAFADTAIANIHSALARLYTIIMEVAAALYPDRWTALTPRLLTIASWVGYDLDGRADIPWTGTLRARMAVEATQIEAYLASVRAITAKARDAGFGGTDFTTAMMLLESRLVHTLQSVRGDLGRLPASPVEATRVAAFSRRLAESRAERLVDAGALEGVITRAIELADPAGPASAGDDIDPAGPAGAGGPLRGDLAVQRALTVLRAELANYGLGTAHAHFRLNATQFVNAVRKQIGLASSPDEPGNRRRYIAALNRLIDEVEPTTINFGSILAETTSAKRLFMLIAQLLKYVDRGVPVRFLIAECETPFPVLVAIYFARMFGVAEHVDISPLFETDLALRHGHEIIEDLLRNPHYRRYVEMRGRVCVQTGFSDAGRYIGQVAASLAIERFRVKLAEVIAREGAGHLDLVIFDTHGESIGRGAHPVSFHERLDYTDPPWCRAVFARNGIAVKQELSFQGGDGFVFFATPDLALATVCRLLENAILTTENASVVTDNASREDIFYEDIDYSLEFFLDTKAFHERLMSEPSYAALLSAFGANLLYPTGSRQTRRQYEGRARGEHAHPSQIRAIPHNAILQQMGFLANSVGGLGRAIAKDRDRFAEVLAGSFRCRQIMALAVCAYRLSSLDALSAYVELFNPVDWLHRAAAEEDERRRERMRRVARQLRGRDQYQPLNDILQIFQHDAIDFEDGMAAFEGDLRLPPVVEACATDLALLHAVRLAVIQLIFMRVAQVPRFSSQPDVTIEDVVDDLFSLDVEPALAALRRAFPRAGPEADEVAFGEAARYRSDAALGYEEEHRELFEPIERLYDLVRRISVGITHIMGAVG